MLPFERRHARLTTVNTIFLPLLRTSRQYRKLLRALGRTENPTTILQDNNYTVNILVYTLPIGPQLVVALYASTQQSRALSPKQLLQRLKKLKEKIIEARGRYFNQADIVYIIYAPAGFTRGAKKLSAKLGITLAETVEAALRSLARYIKARYEKLRHKILGKRIWGPIPLLLYILGYMASQLGAQISIPDIGRILDAVKRGMVLHGA